MATYESSYTIFASYINNGGFKIESVSEEHNVLTGGGFDEFSSGDILNVYDTDPSAFSEAQYFGNTGDGAAVFYRWPVIIIYTTSDSYRVGDTVSISETSFTTCFLEGTRMACPNGERPVEEIAIGDLVLTASGEAKPVRWVGRQSLRLPFADRAHSFPIRIMAGTLGGGLPQRDLFVSPSHALLVDGLLVQARALVNGTSITQVRPACDRFTYFHLEFDAHEISFAEGAPAESFAHSNEARARFDNHAQFVALYGADAPEAAPSPMPRVTATRQLPNRIRKRLAAEPAARRIA